MASVTTLPARPAAALSRWALPDALGVFVAATVFVWLCKRHALYASDDLWATFSWFSVAGVAGIAAASEALILAALCTIYHARRSVIPNRRKSSASLGIALLVTIVAVLFVNLIDAELVPRLGTPLTLSLVRYSDVFGSYDGRAAVQSWVGKDFLRLGAIAIAGASASYVAARLITHRFGARPLLILVLLGLIASSAISFAKSPAWLSKFSESNSLALLRSLSDVGRADFAPRKPVAPPFKLVGADQGVGMPAGKIRNVIIFIIEAGDAQYLDVYGGPYSITPNLSALAPQSVVFKDAYAQATASEVSLQTLLSSRYPPNWMWQVYGPSGLVLLPQILEQGGMRTGFFHSSDVRFGDAEKFLSAARFGTIHDYRDRRCPGALLDDPQRDLGTDDRCTLADLEGWIDKDPDKPSFSVMWTFETHYPYFGEAPPGLHIDPAVVPQARARMEMGRYLGALSDADRLIGSLVRHLQQTGRFDDTLIIVTGDHGQAFGQHGTYGNGGAVHEESVHVPLILISPQLKGPRSSSRLAGHIDIAPTVVDALGLPIPAAWDGTSLFRSAPQRPIYFTNMMDEKVIGYRLGDRKVSANFVRGSVDIFDLSSDPGERKNLADRMPEKEVARYRDWLATWATMVDKRFPH